MNEIDKLDGMVKIKGKCGYEIIGGCSDLRRLEQEKEDLSKLIKGTKDYTEVCSVCKDEVTIYPNISGRTDYTQNEVECRTLAQIITRKNNLEQENETLNYQWHKQSEIGDEWYKVAEKYKTALEEIKGTIKHFKTYFSEKELNKVKFSDITVIEEIITEAIG